MLINMFSSVIGNEQLVLIHLIQLFNLIKTNILNVCKLVMVRPKRFFLHNPDYLSDVNLLVNISLWFSLVNVSNRNHQQYKTKILMKFPFQLVTCVSVMKCRNNTIINN